MSIIFPGGNKDLNLRGMASAEDSKLTNAIIALEYLGSNVNIILVGITISRNAAGQGEGESEGRNEVLHHEANETFGGCCLYTFRLNSGV